MGGSQDEKVHEQEYERNLGGDDTSTILIWKWVYMCRCMSKLTKFYFLNAWSLFYVSYISIKHTHTKFSSGFTSSHCHLNLILKPCCVYFGPVCLSFLSNRFSPLLPHNGLPSSPPSPLHNKVFHLIFFLFSKTFSWLSLGFSAQHTHHPWERSSRWPGPKMYCCSLFLSAIQCFLLS